MRARSRLPLTAALATAGIAVGGCGITNPYQHPTTTTATSSTSTSTTPTTGDIAPAAVAPAGADSPQAAIARYATAEINWTAATLGADQRHLAAISLGAARAMALQTAATYSTGSQLQHSQVTNRGQITSIAAGQGPASGEWVITTREHTTGAGDYAGLPTQPHIYYARLRHTPTGWQITQWSPQN